LPSTTRLQPTLRRPSSFSSFSVIPQLDAGCLCSSLALPYPTQYFCQRVVRRHFGSIHSRDSNDKLHCFCKCFIQAISKHILTVFRDDRKFFKMASRIFGSLANASRSYLHPRASLGKKLSLTQQRTIKTTETGAVASKPDHVSFGLLKVIVVVIPFIYVGAVISREGAAWLEENDIFTPDDDD
ncbi:uncharacterized protein LOC125567908, partial [Nematostella vectensis]|uniref:uncharacterized protein LOC125567908 n=1 Tax=Nematostella vectensis TaxID=45351 RepID=UPI0020773E0E